MIKCSRMYYANRKVSLPGLVVVTIEAWPYSNGYDRGVVVKYLEVSMSLHGCICVSNFLSAFLQLLQYD